MMKEQDLSEHLLPVLLGGKGFSEQLLQDVAKRTVARWVNDFGRIEFPGIANTGCLWFSKNAMAHRYTYDPPQQHTTSRRIYRPGEIILNSDSLLYGLDRHDHLQVMQAGDWLAIPFEALHYLRNKYAKIDKAIARLAEEESVYLQEYTELLKHHPVDRVRMFIAGNPEFMRCSTPEIQAVHLNLSISEYREILKKQG